MKTMQEFANLVKDHIKEYLPERFSKGTAMLQEIVKDGDRHLTGLSIHIKGSSLAPLLYLDDFYDEYRFGRVNDLEDLVHEIADVYAKSCETMPELDVPEFTYEGVKDRLRLRLVGTDRNEKGLKDLAHLSLDNGLALTVCIDMGVKGIARVTHALAESLSNDSEGDLINDAMENTVKNYPAQLIDMENVLSQLAFGTGSQSEENLLFRDSAPDVVPPLMVLSNRENWEGAVAICYPGIQEEISRVVGGNYYVIPCSIHEVLIMPDDGLVEPDALTEMIQSINASEVSLEDQLGDYPLYYDVRTGLLSVVNG